MKLRAIKNINGIINRKHGDIFDYAPWLFDWQGMSEPERVRKGIYIHCFGHGEFEVLNEGDTVELI